MRPWGKNEKDGNWVKFKERRYDVVKMSQNCNFTLPKKLRRKSPAHHHRRKRVNILLLSN